MLSASSLALDVAVMDGEPVLPDIVMDPVVGVVAFTVTVAPLTAILVTLALIATDGACRVTAPEPAVTFPRTVSVPEVGSVRSIA